MTKLTRCTTLTTLSLLCMYQMTSILMWFYGIKIWHLYELLHATSIDNILVILITISQLKCNAYQYFRSIIHCHTLSCDFFSTRYIFFFNRLDQKSPSLWLATINKKCMFWFLGVLKDIQDEFKVDDSYMGLLQTTFVLSYMVMAPAFGYLGDRYSRRWNMISGVALWSATTLIGSYMQSYGSFTIFRAMVGIGEASYSTIAPTIISDLFINDIRSKMLALFYFAIPVGSGFG